MSDEFKACVLVYKKHDQYRRTINLRILSLITHRESIVEFGDNFDSGVRASTQRFSGIGYSGSNMVISCRLNGFTLDMLPNDYYAYDGYEPLYNSI